MNEYLKVIRNHYLDFSGRARRRQYWLFMLINGLITLILALPLLAQTVTAPDPATYSPSGIGLISLAASSLYSLATLLPSLAVAVRRLHDTGRSGWWYLLFLIPIGSLVLLIFYVLDSQPGANKWGPNPKGQERGAAADW